MKYGMWRFTMVNDYAFNAFNAKRYCPSSKSSNAVAAPSKSKGQPKNQKGESVVFKS